MSLSSRTVRTVQPGLRSLVISVPDENFEKVGGVFAPEGTLMDSALWKGFFPRDYIKRFSGFRFITQLDDTKDGGQLLFAKVKTDAERNDPFRTTTRFGNHYWHPILLELKPVKVNGFPLSTDDAGTIANAQRYLMRETFIPAATEGSRFLEEEFFSDVPFVIPHHPTPQASAVTWSFINLRGGFPECLHRKLVIANLAATSTFVIPGQVFPATNFTEWAPYVISDTQELTQGGYYRKRVRVFPPPIPLKIKRIR